MLDREMIGKEIRMLERDMIKRGRNIVVSTIRGRKLRGRFERKFALIRDIVYFSFVAASLVGPLSAFRFISPARVMIRQYLPRWHMAKRRTGNEGRGETTPTWPFLRHGWTSETRKAIVHLPV